MMAFFVDPLPHFIFTHLERARDMAHDVRDHHPIMLVRELSGMKVRDGLPVVFEADDEWILDCFRMIQPPFAIQLSPFVR